MSVVPKPRLAYLRTSGTEELWIRDMFCLLKPREPTVRELRPKNLDGLKKNYAARD